MSLKVGDKIPIFSLLDQTGKKRTDNEFRGSFGSIKSIENVRNFIFYI